MSTRSGLSCSKTQASVTTVGTKRTMASISVSDSTKSEWDELKPDNLTHDEFCQEVIAAYRRDNGEIVDVDAMVEGIKQEVSSQVELAAYRGTKEAIERNGS